MKAHLLLGAIDVRLFTGSRACTVEIGDAQPLTLDRAEVSKLITALMHVHRALCKEERRAEGSA